MMRKTALLCLVLGLGACASQLEEEVVIVEPVVEEPIYRAPAKACDDESDDGIGGTGCSAD